MNFRQRIAWLMVLFYLGATFAFSYYLFEINDHYNQFALDHVQKFHSEPNPDSEAGSKHVSLFAEFWGHMTDIPLTFWLVILLIPYLQIFMMILACTRVEPRLSLAYMWPGLLYLKYQQLCGRGHKFIPVTVISLPNAKNGLPNGHTVIHT